MSFLKVQGSYLYQVVYPEEVDAEQAKQTAFVKV